MSSYASILDDDGNPVDPLSGEPQQNSFRPPRAKKEKADTGLSDAMRERLQNSRLVAKLRQHEVNPIKSYEQIVDVAIAGAQDVADGTIPPAIAKEARGWVELALSTLAAKNAAERPTENTNVQVNVINNLAEQIKMLDAERVKPKPQPEPKALPEPDPLQEQLETIEIRELVVSK